MLHERQISQDPHFQGHAQMPRSFNQRALRFDGRFEFLGSSRISSEDTLGIKTFDAFDFRTELDRIADGKGVLLKKCYDRYAKRESGSDCRQEVQSLLRPQPVALDESALSARPLGRLLRRNLMKLVV